MAQRFSRPVHLVVAGLFVIGLFVQIFLAGMGVFAGSANFETHRGFGYALIFLPVVLIVTSILGRFGARHVVASAIMVGQFILQSVLVAMRDSTPEVAALHPVNGVVILLIASWLLRDAWRVFNEEPATAEAPAPSESPAT
jgi:hypothetical protein